MSLDLKILNFKNQFEEEVKKYLQEIKPKFDQRGLSQLFDAIHYSLSSGGGRVRPLICCLVADYLKTDSKKVLGFALALELIHTYSLIHDDLPAMDNDDFRRGRPSTHKAFSEELAILSGDALNTEAFHVIAKHYSHRPELGLRLIKLLAEKSGMDGMVGGQAIDISIKSEKITLSELEFLHQCKTAALFEAAVLGSALICEASDAVLLKLTKYAQALGLLFQITDDLKDQTQSEEPSIVNVLGLEKAKEYCQNKAQAAKAQVDGSLSEFVEFVIKR